MSKEQTTLGPWLYWSLITISTLSFGLLNIPASATQVMKANAYLAIPIGALLMIPALFALFQLMRRFPRLSLIEVCLKILGPALGGVLGLGYLVTILITLVVFTRDTINLVLNYLMNSTPLVVLVLTYLLIAAYLSSRGIETLSRLASFVILPSLVVISLLFLGVLFNIRINRVLPVFHPELALYLPGGVSVLHGYYPLALVGMITPYLQGFRAKIPRLTSWGILIIIFFYMLFTFGTIGIFGYDYLGRFIYPGLDAIHVVEFPYLLLEQAGLLMIIAWITLVVVGSSFHYYAVSLGLAQITGVLDYKRFVWLLFPLKLYLIMCPQNINEAKQFMQYANNYGWLILFGLPVLLYLLSLVFKQRSGQHED